MNAAPGAMTQRKERFAAFAELLERGSTDQLSRDRPSQSRGLPEPTASAPVLFPTVEDWLRPPSVAGRAAGAKRTGSS